VSTTQPDVPTPAPTPDDVAGAIDRVRPRIRPFAAHLLYFDAVSSTNDIADRVAASGAEEGTTVLAGMQYQGRGRMGRTWHSPAGAGLYVSVVCRPRLGASGVTDRRGAAAAGVPALTLVAGVAIAEALRSVSGLPVEIKWPNDLLVARRKLCGILAEASAAEGVLRYVILGFGINLRSAAYPVELADRVTSIEAELGRPIERGAVLAESLVALAARYREFGDGCFSSVLGRWRALSPSSVGAAVSWTASDGLRRGTTAGVDDDGALLVRTAAGLERIVAGELTWLQQ
jgi:BirA family biotin operon repressor/biotin-[acetyl-CoA-carboxylase] ligase